MAVHIFVSSNSIRSLFGKRTPSMDLGIDGIEPPRGFRSDTGTSSSNGESFGMVNEWYLLPNAACHCKAED